MKLDIEWPGMPEEHQMVFKNVEFEEDLFSYIKRKSLDFESGGLEEDDEEWNEEVEEN